MKIRFLHLFLILNLSAFLAGCGLIKGGQLHKQLTITFSESYCGGAAPPDEFLKDLATVKPYANRNMELFTSPDLSSKPILVLTNEKGELIIPKGLGKIIYISIYPTDEIFTPNKNSEKTYLECYKKFVIRELKKVSLSKKSSSTVNFEILCNPCVPPAP